MPTIDPDPKSTPPLIAALTTFFAVFIGFWLGVIYVDHEPFVFEWHPAIRFIQLVASVSSASVAGFIATILNITRR